MLSFVIPLLVDHNIEIIAALRDCWANLGYLDMKAKDIAINMEHELSVGTMEETAL